MPLAATVGAPPSASQPPSSPVASPQPLAASIPGARPAAAGAVAPRPPRKPENLDASQETVEKLGAAVQAGDVASVQGLLAALADPDGAGAGSGEAGTPLFRAVEGGHLPVVEALINARADVNIATGSETPMTLAFKKGHKDVLCALFGATFTELDEVMSKSLASSQLGSGVLESTQLMDEDVMVEKMKAELGGQAQQMMKMEHVRKGRGKILLDDMPNLPSEEEVVNVRQQEVAKLLGQIHHSSLLSSPAHAALTSPAAQGKLTS